MLGRSASLPSEPAALARRSVGEGGWVIAPDVDQGFVARTREVWQYRRILWFFSAKALESLYSKTHLGVWWIFIRTLVPLGIGSFVYGSIMQVPSGGVPYFVFFLVGQVPWNFFDGPVIRGSRGLETNRNLLTKLYVPRIILPLGQMTAGIVEPVIITLVLIATLVYYRVNQGIWHAQASPRLFACLASVALILAFAFSIALWTSVWQARARDARFVLRYVVSFWLYFTPVIYPLSVVPAGIRWAAYLNPLTAPIETFRWGMLAGLEHSWAWFGYSAAITVATFAGGAWYFTRTEAATMDKL
jgi:lipopolysaccharide transport system permease protein